MIDEPKQLGLNRRQAVEVFGGNVRLFNKCERAGWITPIGTGASALYDWENIKGAWQRLRTGEQPRAKRK